MADAFTDRYTQLFEQNTAIQLLADPATGGIVDANQAASDYYGLTRSDLARRRIADLTPDPASITTDELEVAVLVGARLTAFPQRHASGETRLVDLYAGPLTLGDRLLVHIIVHDVTERERAAERERALLAERVALALMERAAHEWQGTFDAIDLPIMVVDDAGRLTRVNAAVGQLLDSLGALAEGTSLGALNASSLGRVVAERVQVAREIGQASPTRVLDERRRTWEVWATRFIPPSETAPRLIVVARELTALIDLQRDVQRNETMARMGELVAGVAHEIRNPLFALSSAIDAMRARFGDAAPADLARYYPVLTAQVQRLSDLTRDLLEYGRPMQLSPEPCLAADLLRLTIEQTKAVAASRRVSVTARTLPTDGRLVVDRGRILQVLQNLVLNAIQHSVDGGGVELTAGLEPSDGHRSWRLEVRDHGPGFANDALPHVFEPFFTKRPGGTGLGLALAHRIVADHGGTIGARNHDGGGGLVTVSLPVPPA